MALVLKEFWSLANGAVSLGVPFPVGFRVVGAPSDSGVISVSCVDPAYSASPNIPVALGPGETSKVDQADIVIAGPPGAATVLVEGVLVETHDFPQDVQ